MPIASVVRGKFRKKNTIMENSSALKNIVIVFIIGFCCFSCKKNEKREILLVENHYFDILHDSLSEKLTLFADSNFVFTKTYKSADNENIENRKGRFYIKKDTIHFSRNLLNDSESKKAIVKDGYLEIIDKEACYKIKVLATELPNRTTYDNQKFKNYAIFSYCQTRDSDVFVNGQQHELNNKEIAQMDSLLNICMKQNSRLKNRNNNDYIKQCIATNNKNNEVIVWLYCICSKSGFNFGDDFQRQIIGKVYDGGNCYFRLKINLTTQTYFDLSINGDA
jgi:hypothetical protein